LSELANRVNERIANSISEMTCILVHELSVSLINIVMCVHLGGFNRKFKEHMI